jgi:hypothetical protein
MKVFSEFIVADISISHQLFPKASNRSPQATPPQSCLWLDEAESIIFYFFYLFSSNPQYLNKKSCILAPNK